MTNEPEAPPEKVEKKQSTMSIMIDAIQRTNEKALDTVAEQSSANSRRMWLVIILVICVLAAVIGVTAQFEFGDVKIGASPEEEEAATPEEPKETKENRTKGRKGAKP